MKRRMKRRQFVKDLGIKSLGALIPAGLLSSEMALGYWDPGGYAPESDRIFPGIAQNTHYPVHSSGISHITNEIILHGRRNNQAWFEPAIGVIPGDGINLPQVFVRATLLTGDDIGPQFYLNTVDLGKSWSNPVLCQNWYKVPMDDDIFEEPWFGFHYHEITKKFLALGYTHFVRDRGVYDSTIHKNESHYQDPALRRSIIYSLWDAEKADFTPWKRMSLPDNLYLGIYQNGQFHEMDDGSILIPGYYFGSRKEEAPQNNYSRITVLRCAFDGKDLHFVEHGNVHTVEQNRGLHEPSLIRFKGRFYLTIRHDQQAYAADSDDGLNFGSIIPWRFDDGRELGSYNTQQKWLKHKDILYLIYNRRSELNKGVFRSRAPLYIAEVDVNNLVVKKKTERIVFPEKGARMGNFNVANVLPDESWVVSGEWIQGKFGHVEEGQRFWLGWEDVNYLQYIGDLLLARIFHE